MTAKIPQGIKAGCRLRCQGNGDLGSQGAPPGDLFVEIPVNRRRIFGRGRNHAILERRIAMASDTPDGGLEVPAVPGGNGTIQAPGQPEQQAPAPVGAGPSEFEGSGKERGVPILALSVPMPKALAVRRREFAGWFAGGISPGGSSAGARRTVRRVRGEEEGRGSFHRVRRKANNDAQARGEAPWL
ncbi:MAG: hypothetical protein LBR80_10665 [Deltaproteobacteria bacterium]|jgi:molecular chaperone DnaJ|nr:hypothetical protein [Deltaproteobacteria bacterium]